EVRRAVVVALGDRCVAQSVEPEGRASEHDRDRDPIEREPSENGELKGERRAEQHPEGHARTQHQTIAELKLWSTSKMAPATRCFCAVSLAMLTIRCQPVPRSCIA